MSGDKYYISDQHGCYFVTFTVIHWIDIFSRRNYRDIIIESLNFCIAKKGLIVYSWVIMSNHIHLIITTKNKTIKISNLICDFKKHTSKEIVKKIKIINESRREWLLNAMGKEATRIGRAPNFKLWRDDNHAILIDGKIVDIIGKLNYIHENPVRNGIVENDWEYIYSSAKDYQINKKGLVNIDFAF